MTSFQHQQVAIGYAVEPINYGAMVETYVRPWPERLMSWPWRPWVRTAVRPTTLARMIKLNEMAREEMARITDASLFKD